MGPLFSCMIWNSTILKAAAEESAPPRLDVQKSQVWCQDKPPRSTQKNRRLTKAWFHKLSAKPYFHLSKFPTFSRSIGNGGLKGRILCVGVLGTCIANAAIKMQHSHKCLLFWSRQLATQHRISKSYNLYPRNMSKLNHVNASATSAILSSINPWCAPLSMWNHEYAASSKISGTSSALINCIGPVISKTSPSL